MHLLLADDHALFRDALVELLQRATPGVTLTAVKNLQEVLAAMERRIHVDLILLDVNMPGMDGLGGLKKIRDRYPSVPVALISGAVEQDDVKTALNMGAMGYLPKTLPGKDLVAAINKIVSGQVFVTRDRETNQIMPSYYGDRAPGDKKAIAQQGVFDVNQELLQASDVNLTPREREVLSYLMRGAPNKEIANALGLQVVTVKLHIRGICRKLNVKNRTQAALRARETGLMAASQE